MVHLPVQRNLHRDGILAVTRVHGAQRRRRGDRGRGDRARRARIADGLDYVGVLCVEFFVLEDGALVVNEMAPRPHNSGPLQHRRVRRLAVRSAGAHAGRRCRSSQPRQHSPRSCSTCSATSGCGGSRARHWRDVLALPGAHLHLYGKAEARPGRKMGHLTLTAETADDAEANAADAARLLGLPWPARAATKAP